MSAISPPAPPRAVAPREPAATVPLEPATAVAVASRTTRAAAALRATGRTLALCAVVLLIPGEAGKIGPSLSRRD
ncbi:MAG TPA: hypothetical protein VN238_19605 [Solirubrobacteraceae bacterium]|nr:hypothetical protein [Solirubrobacteraceae bacterium]